MQSIAPGLTFGLGIARCLRTRRDRLKGFYSLHPIALMLAWDMRKRIARLALVTVAAGAIVVPAVAGLGVYFEHITGSPFVTAYQISQNTYGWPMGLAWTPPPKIQNRHIEMQRYYEYELIERDKVGTVGGFLEFLTFRLQEYWRFFLGPMLTIPLLMLGRMWKRRPMLVVGAAAAVAAVLMEGAASPHYLAPATAVLVAMVAEGCRYFDGLRLRLAPLLLAAMAALLVSASDWSKRDCPTRRG